MRRSTRLDRRRTKTKSESGAVSIGSVGGIEFDEVEFARWSPFEHCGTRVYPDMFSLAQAHRAFDDDGQIGIVELRQRFEATIVAFMDLVEASKHYPCVKTAWVEFLGEYPDAVVDRVQ